MILNNEKDVVKAVQETTQRISEHYKKYDHSKFIELHKKLLNDRELLNEFKQDPDKIVEKETGIPNLEGAHYHFFDENNDFFPPEDDHVQDYLSGSGEKPWSRIEIRLSSAKGTSLGICFIVCQNCYLG